MDATTCEGCGGTGKQWAMFPVYAPETPPEKKRPALQIVCPRCRGEGVITPARRACIEAGRRLRDLRLKAGYGLRGCAAYLGVDPVALSQIEQGWATQEETEQHEKRLAELPQ